MRNNDETIMQVSDHQARAALLEIDERLQNLERHEPAVPIPLAAASPSDAFASLDAFLRLATDPARYKKALREFDTRIKAADARELEVKQLEDVAAAKNAALDRREQLLLARSQEQDERENELREREKIHEQHWDAIREACAEGRRLDEMCRRHVGKVLEIYRDDYFGGLTQSLPDWGAIERGFGIGVEPDPASELEAAAPLVFNPDPGFVLQPIGAATVTRSSVSRRSERRAAGD